MAEPTSTPISTTLLDDELVKRARRGDVRAFDILVRRYQHRIVALAARHVRDWAQAEDIAQEAFVRAYRALESFRGESSFYTWLYRITVNVAKNHLQAQKRKVPLADMSDDGLEALSEDLALQSADTPEQALVRQQTGEALLAALATLPGELRQALLLRELEGLDYQQIAERLNCPVGTVRSRIFRARENIDEKLRPLLDGRATTRARVR